MANQLLNSCADDTTCWWGAGPLLTLDNLQGTPGTCVYSASYSLHTSPYAALCNLTSSALTRNFSYPANLHLVAPSGAGLPVLLV